MSWEFLEIKKDVILKAGKTYAFSGEGGLIMEVNGWSEIGTPLFGDMIHSG